MRPTWGKHCQTPGSFRNTPIVQQPASQTRHFNLDLDLRPVGHAPSGCADIVMDYNDFLLGVEVTLTTSSRQEAAEGEPVRRHIDGLRDSASGKPVYGLFVAPKIDINTAETFRVGNWYRGATANRLDIVPFNLNQMIRVVEKTRRQRPTPSDFRTLLDRCLMTRNSAPNVWLNEIESEVNRWCS